MPTYAEDNAFPYITLVETADPSTPAANTKRVWLDTDGVLKVIDEAAAVTDWQGSGGDVATDAIWTTAGKVAVATGTATATEQWPPGHEFDYAQVTSGGNITATVEASADTLITGASVTYDGSTVVIIEAYFLGLASPSGQTAYLLLFDGSTSLGYIAQGMVNLNPTVYVRRRLTPSAGAHTYSIRAITTGGTATFTAGAGGAGANMPAFMRITKA